MTTARRSPIPAGWQRAERWSGPSPWPLVGLLYLTGLGGALAQSAIGLFGWRLLEAVGDLGVIVSAPVQAPRAWR